MPTWWERDPRLLEHELRSLREAGFRLRQRRPLFESLLMLDLERGSARYRLYYPAGFPSVGAIASAGWTLPATVDAWVGRRARPGGSGVLALEELIHGQRSGQDFAAARFGVVLAGPWEQLDDGPGGTLLALTSGRGTAVLPISVTGTTRRREISLAAGPLFRAFDGPTLKGWWVRGEALRWGDGLAGIAKQVETAISRQHGLRSKQIWSEPRPLLGYASPSRLPGATVWQFISRGAGGGRALGLNEVVAPSSFQVRAPYAAKLQDARVVLIGCGSLGWPIASGLARAGVRRFSLFDGDRLFPGNLARLGAHLAQTGQRKVDALREHLHQVASGMVVQVFTGFIGDLLDARALVEPRPDLIIDAAADEATPSQTNAAALTLGAPAIYTWMVRGVRSARIFRVVPGRTPCYACVANARPRSLVDAPRSDAPEFDQIGANFNIDPIAAATVKMAVRTLAGDAVDASNPDHLILRVGGPVPVAEALRFQRDPKCRWCR